MVNEYSTEIWPLAVYFGMVILLVVLLAKINASPIRMTLQACKPVRLVKRLSKCWPVPAHRSQAWRPQKSTMRCKLAF